MWELIKLNKRKTFIFWLLTGAFLFLLAFIMMAVAGPTLEAEGINRNIIIYLLIIIWLVLSVISYFFADKILLKISEAKKVDRATHPQLFNVVEEMRIAANLSVMPDIYIIPSLSINAFATGLRMENSTIVVTAGLLSKLNRAELQAVIAHETAHILNRDMVLLTFLGTLWSSFTIVAFLVSYILLQRLLNKSSGQASNSSRWRNRRNRRRNSRAFRRVFLTSAGIAGRVFYSILSKTREYLADATAVRLTRNPNALASALEKIDVEKNKLEVANSITAPMYIENPLKKKFVQAATHPPIKKRIKILKAMSKGAHYREYQRAYNSVMNQYSTLFPKSVLRKDTKVEIKARKEEKIKQEQTNQAESQSKKTKAKVSSIDCNCGTKIKIPSNLKQNKISCPSCGRFYNLDKCQGSEFNTKHFKAINFINGVDELTERDVKTVKENKTGEMYYKLSEGEWDSFSCQCGFLVQIPPNYAKGFIDCKNCEQRIKLQSEAKNDDLVEWIKKDNKLGSYIVMGDEWKKFHCECGKVLSLSPNFSAQYINCKKCGDKITVKSEDEVEKNTTSEKNNSLAKDDLAQEDTGDLEVVAGEFIYYKEEDAWQTFSCVCGASLEISPAFILDSKKCNKCQREIKIKMEN